jgi:CRP-like cAMP-binding protein
MEMTHEELKNRFPGLTRRFTEADSEALLRALIPADLEAGEVLVTHGAHTDTMYLVRKGLLSIDIEEDGKRLILGQAGPGMVVGEVGMLVPGPASATVAAIEATSLLSLSADDFLGMGETDPKAATALLQCLSQDLAKRMRHASAGLLRRIDEHTWMKLEAKKDRKAWMLRLATVLIGQEENR